MEIPGGGGNRVQIAMATWWAGSQVSKLACVEGVKEGGRGNSRK